ncbi:MAG TPA: hypothetical protein VKY85_21430 [Candidatus Angelobacter sp.]|nr:hypothetical protein [Candidatus Angelobacter sp.]
MEILAARTDDISSVSADMLATANVECMIQLRAGVEQRREPASHACSGVAGRGSPPRSPFSTGPESSSLFAGC